MRDFYIRSSDIPTAFPTTVLPYLQSCRRDGFVAGYDGQKLHYAVFVPEHPAGTVVISHGFTESTEKYHELIWCFLHAGYTVWIPDHRGHGTSFRSVPDTTLTHIDRFEEYVDDFALFMEEVCRHTEGKPCLFAHSMGCAIGTLYMESHPESFRRAFLSSPMVQPSSGAVPVFLARAILHTAVLFGKGKKRAFVSPPYTGKERFEDSCKTCRERFDEYEQIKETHPEYQNSCTTYGWAYQSFRVGRLLLRKGAPERVALPVFIAMAGQDTVVARPPQLALARRLPHAITKIYPTAKHEIFGSDDATVFSYLDDVIDFFAS